MDLRDHSPDNSLKLSRSLAPQKFRKAGKQSREYSSFIVLLVAFANTCRLHSDTCQPLCKSQPELTHFKYCFYRTAFRVYLGVWVLSSLLKLEIKTNNKFCRFFWSCQHLLSQLGAEGHVPGVVLLRVVHRDRGHLCQVSVVGA